MIFLQASKRCIAGFTLLLAATSFACATATTPVGQQVAGSRDGVSIAYDVHGHGTTTLLFVHGWSCDRTYWRHQIDAFSADYQVAVMDLAGHGSSGAGRSDYTMTSFAHDVEAVVDNVGAKRVILIGHSMGGAVIAEAARLLPDRVIGLIGVDTLQDVSGTIGPEVVDAAVLPFQDDFGPAMKNFTTAFFTPDTPEPLVKWIEEDMAAAPPQVAISALRDYLGLYVSGEGARVFEDIKVPVHCLNALKWPTSTESNRNVMHSFDVTLMQGVGHFLMLEKPQEFNEKLQVMVDEILSQP